MSNDFLKPISNLNKLIDSLRLDSSAMRQMGEIQQSLARIPPRHILGPMWELQESLKKMDLPRRGFERTMDVQKAFGLASLGRMSELLGAVQLPDEAVGRYAGMGQFAENVFKDHGLLAGSAINSLLAPIIETQRRLAALLTPAQMFHAEEALKLGLGPTLAIRDIMQNIGVQEHFGSLIVPQSGDGGALTWVTPDDSELRMVPIRESQPTDNGRRLNVQVDVRCSRCGGSLLVKGASHTLLSDDNVDDLRLNVMPWCHCLSQWDGTAPGLIGSVDVPPLLIVRAGASDGLPAGSFHLGDAATMLDAVHSQATHFLREAIPKALHQLEVAFERFNSGDAEALSHALTSCRRLLQTVADAVFPPTEDRFTDSRGKLRKVGPEEYKNRLLAFFDRKLSRSSLAIVEAETEHVASRLDALYDKVCKGVHSDVGPDEVQLVLFSTCLLIAEVARLVRNR